MKFTGKYAIFVLLAILFIVFIVLAILSTGTHGGPDDYVHFRIARYSFRYPELFLDHWGKPIFTLLASPFAQFGFIGMKIFNIIIGTFAAYILYLLLKLRNYKLSLLAPVFLFLAPIYTVLLVSGMTEVLFSFLLILTIYLFFSEKYIVAAIVASFLPIARTEAIILIPFIILAFSLRRKWSSLPFLFSAFLVYSLIGTFFRYHDFLWLIHENPYKFKEPAYGSGELLHFVKQLKNIIGLPLLFISVPGFIFAFYNLFKNGIRRQNPESEEILLILLPLVVFFTAHSFLWWKGLGSSLGLIRVMACIIPLWVFYCVKGMDFFADKLKNFKVGSYVALFVLSVFVIITPFKVFSIPIRRSIPNELMKGTAEWMKSNNTGHHTIYYFEPYLITALEVDPFDKKICNEGLPNIHKPSEGIPDSSLIVWDSSFGANDWKLPKENLINDPDLKLLKIFKPQIPYIVWHKYEYEIYVFQKVLVNR